MTSSYVKKKASEAPAEYYIACQEGPDGELDPTKSVDDYYSGSGKEPPGRWFVGLRDGQRSTSLGFENGQKIDADAFRALIAGFNPITGEKLTQNSGDPKRIALHDWCLSAPKSFSIAWAFAEPALKAELERSQEDSSRLFLDFMSRHSITRRGAQGIEKHAAPLLGATYAHGSSREDDMQQHTHCTIANVSETADGKKSALETTNMMRWTGAAASLYHASRAWDAVQQGFSIVKNEDNPNLFEIAGVPKEVIEKFSKRSKQVKEKAKQIAEEKGLDAEAGAISRGILSRAAGESRDAKNAKTREELQLLWNEQGKELGFAQEQVAALTNNQFVVLSKEEIADIAYQSLSEITANHAVFREPALVTKVANALLGKASPDQILEAVENLKKYELMQTVAKDERTGLEEEIFTTREMLLTEYQLIQLAHRQDGRHELKNVVLSDTLKPEQRAAALHVLQDANAVSVMEGAAGSGKSYTLGKVTEAYTAAGYKTTGISGSWNAALNLAREAKLADGRAITGWLADLKNRKIQLTDKDVILVDEAGMVGATHMRDILKFAERAGSKVILTGDTLQQKSIAAGDPLRQIVKEIGSARLDQIVRQKKLEDRQAAKDFFEGHAEEGLESYSQKGQVHIIASTEELHKRVVSDWQKSRVEHAGKEHLMLASTRPAVKAMNQLAHEARKANGELGESRTFATMDCAKDEEPMEFSVGDKVVIRRTNRHEDVVNRTQGTITGFNGTVVHLQTEKGPLEIDSSQEQWQYIDDKGKKQGFGMQHAYCMTTYASQGATVDHTFLTDSTSLHRASVGVGASRHRDDCNIYINKQERYEAKMKFCSDDDWHSIDSFKDEEILARVASSWSKEQKKEAALDHSKWRKCGGELDLAKEESIEKILEENSMAQARRAVERARVESQVARINPSTAKTIGHAEVLGFQRSKDYVLEKPTSSEEQVQQALEGYSTQKIKLELVVKAHEQGFVAFDAGKPVFIGRRPEDKAIVNIARDGERSGALRDRFPPMLTGEKGNSKLVIVATGEDALHVWTHADKNGQPLPSVIVGPSAESLSMPHIQEAIMNSSKIVDHSLKAREKEVGLDAKPSQEREVAPQKVAGRFDNLLKKNAQQGQSNSPAKQSEPKEPTMEEIRQANAAQVQQEVVVEKTAQMRLN